MSIQIAIPTAYKELFKPYRYKVYYGGRGAGKSQSVALALLVMGMQKPTRILCTREFQSSIADSVHRLLSDLIAAHKMDGFYEVLQSTIRGINGTEFIFKGLKHNITEIKGLEGVDICFVEEAENISERSWELLIPTIRKEGSEIWIVLNPRNATDPTYKRFISVHHDDVLLKKVSWRDNPFFPDVLDKERQKLEKQDIDTYKHVWEGELDTRRSGAIYAKQLDKARAEGRITTVPYDPAYEVFTAWDLGYGDATAIWFLQWVGRELRWLEYYENNGEQIDHYVRIVKDKPYNYMRGGHFLPHDGGAGNIRGDSVSLHLSKLGLANTVLEREQDINPGIEKVRQALHYSVFDANKCAVGIAALEAYGYKWDEERGVFKDKPNHNWASNGADSARYAVIASENYKNGPNTVNVSFRVPSRKSFMGY